MNNDDWFGIIMGILIIAGIILAGQSMQRYEQEHPCLEWKEYCYYETHDVSVGVGPVISGDGGIGVSVVPTTAKIYIDCENTEHIPEKIKTEKNVLIENNDQTRHTFGNSNNDLKKFI